MPPLIWPPPPIVRDGDDDKTLTPLLSTGDLLTSLAGVALLGYGVYTLHQRGQLGATVSAVVDALVKESAPAMPPPPQPRKPRRRTATPKKRARAIPKNAAPPPPPPMSSDEQDTAAARLLGVSLDASEDQIRGAFRRVVADRLRAGRGFGDLANDAREKHETITITAAKNRLIDRAKQRRGNR